MAVLAVELRRQLGGVIGVEMVVVVVVRCFRSCGW